MANDNSPKCKKCRQDKIKLFLKGKKCIAKCTLDRKAYSPGQHGQKPSKPSEYALHLREKQKLRRIYGLLERQFKNYFLKARKEKGVTGENLIKLLERRLDNSVYRCGFAVTRSQARQFVGYGHVFVNDKKIDIPSCQIKAGDVIKMKASSKLMEKIKENISLSKERGVPAWIEVDEANLAGIVKMLPTRQDFILPIDEQMIIEFYSR